MTAFYEQPSATRFATANEAEEVFDRLYPYSAPWGIDHPPFNVQNLPALLRYAPDRIQGHRFVEAKGVGKDGVFKVKLEQLFSLQWWNAIWPVQVFIWDSYRKRYTTISITELVNACQKHGVLSQFPEGKSIWRINIEFLPVEWADDT